MHSAFSGLSHVGADGPFAGLAFNKMRSASAKPAARQAPRDSTHVRTLGESNASRSFHAPREPQHSTRLGRPCDKTFSRSKVGTCLMRLPSAVGGPCAPWFSGPLATRASASRGPSASSRPAFYRWRQSRLDRRWHKLRQRTYRKMPKSSYKSDPTR